MCTHFMYSTSGREKKTDPYPGTAQCQRGSCSVHSAKQKKEATLKQRKKNNFILLTTGSVYMLTFTQKIQTIFLLYFLWNSACYLLDWRYQVIFHVNLLSSFYNANRLHSFVDQAILGMKEKKKEKAMKYFQERLAFSTEFYKTCSKK